MGLDERTEEVQNDGDEIHHTQDICLHAFADLSRVLPPMFVSLLKACYIRGTEKATKKFRVLQQQIVLVLQNSPQPGPATYVVHCLLVLPILGPLYTEGFSHLLTSSLCRLQSIQPIPAEPEAKRLAAQLFVDAIGGCATHEARVLLKLLEVVDVRIENIEEIMCGPGVNDDTFSRAKAYIEPYIYGLVESQSYMMAVTLMERFSIRQSGQEFLLKMIQEKQFQAAEKWAAFMGKQMLCVLIKKYIDMKLPKYAYDSIRKNNLQEEFPDVYYMYKESSLKKLAEKGCWNVAEARTNGNKQLIEYLVYLAMEAGYSEKVNELCETYSLDGFAKAQEPRTNPSNTRHLQLNELVLEEIQWVDEVDGLCRAISYLEECKVIGVDCEWKPNYVKGSKPNKVSIMQIASEKTVFIFDLIKLFEDAPNVLDSCLKRIVHSPSVLKLGYNLQCDLKQLSHSYGELECFKHYEMLLDIQNVFKEPRGGLSGLAEKVLGASLNKTRRNSDWEQRPLSQYQMEYAALDAAVLIHIFRHVRNQHNVAGVNNEQPKMEWRSYIVSHMDETRKHKTKKTPKKNKKASPSAINMSFN